MLPACELIATISATACSSICPLGHKPGNEVISCIVCRPPIQSRQAPTHLLAQNPLPARPRRWTATRPARPSAPTVRAEQPLLSGCCCCGTSRHTSHLGLAATHVCAAPSPPPAAGFACHSLRDYIAYGSPVLATTRLCADFPSPSAAGSTCCCMRDFFGFCFTWACCPLPEATCCNDHQHCCPSNLPVCDTTAGRCLASAGQGYAGSVEWSTKTPAMTQVTVLLYCSVCRWQ